MSVVQQTAAEEAAENEAFIDDLISKCGDEVMLAVLSDYYEVDVLRDVLAKLSPQQIANSLLKQIECPHGDSFQTPLHSLFETDVDDDDVIDRLRLILPYTAPIWWTTVRAYCYEEDEDDPDAGEVLRYGPTPYELPSDRVQRVLRREGGVVVPAHLVDV